LQALFFVMYSGVMTSFEDTGLDPRIVRALQKKGYDKPTPVQSEAIPKVSELFLYIVRFYAELLLLAPAICPKPFLTVKQYLQVQALEGKDIVARARTGSGKTMAYLLPALQKILTGDQGRAGWQALILVPTKELCEQVRTN
jgi:ATP-dependent RNA helicase DDX56/DBP9